MRPVSKGKLNVAPVANFSFPKTSSYSNPGRGPAWQYRTIPESVTPRTAGEIAAMLTNEDWTEVARRMEVKEPYLSRLLASVSG